MTLVVRRYSERLDRKPIPLFPRAVKYLPLCTIVPLLLLSLFLLCSILYFGVYCYCRGALFILKANVKLRDNITSTKDLQTPLWFFSPFFLSQPLSPAFSLLSNLLGSIIIVSSLKTVISVCWNPTVKRLFILYFYAGSGKQFG